MTFAFRAFIAAILIGTAMLAALPAVAQDAAWGEDRYTRHCQNCHGLPPDAAALRGAGDYIVIKQSIANSPIKSGWLRPPLVWDEDLHDIAEWLRNPVHIEPPPPLLPPPPVVPAFNVTDLWWNAAEPGWGLNLIHHADTNGVFGVIYTYDTSRRPLWLVLPGGRWDTPRKYLGDLYRTRGPRVDQLPFDQTRVSVDKVGNFILEFTSADTGTLLYFMEGVRVEKAIARQPF